MRLIRYSALLLLVLLASCSRSSTPSSASGSAGKFSAEITRTSLGIPHIKAKDFGGIGRVSDKTNTIEAGIGVKF